MEESVRKETRIEEAKKLLEKMNEEYGISKVGELIKNNQILFPELIDGRQYRTRLLNEKEKDEFDTLRRKKFGQLLQDKDILMEKDLISLYKERGIDIEELDKEIVRINRQVDELNIKLGKILTENPTDSILKTYKEEIEILLEKLYETTIQKSQLLTFSLENQLMDFEAKILSYLSLDIQIGEKWNRAFYNIDDFLVSNTKLINLAAIYSAALNYK